MVRGLIFDIERFAVDDGPGIRTTLFMKGCPLTCWWCHNPEAISGRPQLVFFENKCIGCGVCFDVCPVGAQVKVEGGGRSHDRDACTLCGTCVQNCGAEALVIEGREISVDAAVEELSQDEAFYASSGGGITLSGGEPMRQPDFCAEVLRRCRERGFHTALDTSGFAPWEDFEKVLAHTSLVLYDLKLADPAEHLRFTGVSNELVLSNLSRIDRRGLPVEVRIPLVPGINDSPENLQECARILRGLDHLSRVLVLPYHRMGVAKYARLGKTYRLPETRTPSREEVHSALNILTSRGIPAEAR